ncbi:VC0807 family protein [Algivirga pacifica]|uniref:MFS transporter n=1 Tax=Algivirga pacifica TaxID=1162670 RepID=A0ABP9D8F9_9BACT
MSDKKKQESPLNNLLINILIPTVILSKFSDEEYLGPTLGLIVAVGIPVLYGIYDYIKTRKVNFFSVMGFVSVLLTGTVGLLELPKEYIAIKEAAIPFIIGLVVLISMKTKFPLVEKLLYNPTLIRVDKINASLEEQGNESIFKKKLNHATILLAFSFFLSAALNFILAKVLIVSDPGTVAFNEELGQMTAWSFVVIAIPSTLVMFAALWYLIKAIKQCTGLEMEEVLVGVKQ